MGTRHLIAVVKDQKFKVAQYGQWDGYPSGQGVDILAFLQQEELAVFAKKISEVTFITNEELQARWTECGASPVENLVPIEVSECFSERYPENSRDSGANVLNIIQHADRPILLNNALQFAADSLFCEWGYVIDLDKGTFEVYEGFNKNPLDAGERFAFLQEENSEYYPIRQVASYPLQDLPSEATFLTMLEEIEEEA